MKTIKDYEVSGKKVIIRCDLNVPMKDLIVNAIGAIFFSIFGYFGINSKKEEDYEKLIVLKKRKKDTIFS